MKKYSTNKINKKHIDELRVILKEMGFKLEIVPDHEIIKMCEYVLVRKKMETSERLEELTEKAKNND